uniref:DUF4283 domain-containing protein n=1 Tax=Tanacetum cinerariifolium TaxID=118510 RepID=A0A699GHY7_TANCI|nr:hypothetical protein [Tanacetum cinerariifolium]
MDVDSGFLASNKKDKKNEGGRKDIDDAKAASDLAAKIKNIKGKVIGRKHATNVTTDLGVSLANSGSGDGVKKLDDTIKPQAANVGQSWVDEYVAGKSIPMSFATAAEGVSKTQQEEANKESSPKAVGFSFASMFHYESVKEDAPIINKRVKFRSIVNEERVANHDTMLPRAAKEGVMSRYANTLAGYFLLKMDNGVFLFKFNTKNGMDQVIERGPWLIHNTPLILNKWAPNISLKPDEVTKVPVWVKLYNVLVVAYSKDELRLIATQVGKPIMLDVFASFMCVDSWGRISFARALIEIQANSELKKEVKMAIPIDDDDGNGYISEVIRVEYEWTPPHCLECKLYRHNIEKCPKMKNKWKKVANHPKNQIAGIRFHKPKSSLYRPINKQVNDKKSKNKTARNDKASTSHASGEKSTPTSNTSSVLNLDKGADCGDTVPTNDVGMAQNVRDMQNPKSGMEEGVSEREKDSLWTKFQAEKEA